MCVGLQQLEPDQYREVQVKNWSKFYRCCLEYQELASQPLALVQDPRTGMGVVLKQSLFSFLRPAHVVECIGSSVPLQGDSKLVGGGAELVTPISIVRGVYCASTHYQLSAHPYFTVDCM